MPDATIPVEAIIHIMTLTANGPPPAAYAAIDAVAQRVFDHRLFTVTRSLHETVEVERVYSSNTAAYPIGGRKQKLNTPWGEQVLDRGEVLLCHGPGSIEHYFADHVLIRSLGVNGMVNIPVLFAGRSIATMNMSHADRFQDADVPAMRVLAALLLPLVMAGVTG